MSQGTLPGSPQELGQARILSWSPRAGMALLTCVSLVLSHQVWGTWLRQRSDTHRLCSHGQTGEGRNKTKAALVAVPGESPSSPMTGFAFRGACSGCGAREAGGSAVREGVGMRSC